MVRNPSVGHRSHLPAWPGAQPLVVSCLPARQAECLGGRPLLILRDVSRVAATTSSICSPDSQVWDTRDRCVCFSGGPLVAQVPFPGCSHSGRGAGCVHSGLEQVDTNLSVSSTSNCCHPQGLCSSTVVFQQSSAHCIFFSGVHHLYPSV